MNKKINIAIYLLLAGLMAAWLLFDYVVKEVEITSIDGSRLEGTAPGKIVLGILDPNSEGKWEVKIVGTAEPTNGRWQYYLERDMNKYIAVFTSDKFLETNVTYDSDDLEYEEMDIFFVKSGMSIDSTKGNRVKGVVPEEMQGTIYVGYLDLNNSPPEVVFIGTTAPINGTWEYEFENFERGEFKSIFVLISEKKYQLGKTYNLDEIDDTSERSDTSSLHDPGKPDLRFLFVVIFIILAIISYKEK